MPMHGGWTMSMMWMPMPDRTWAAAAASFVAMWILMMVPMMLPTVAPVLWRHRAAAVKSGARHPGTLPAVAGVAYFFVWAALGVAVFPAGALGATVIMHEPSLARAAPILAGVTVMVAGAIQFTSWKAHQLACCRWRSSPEASRPAGASAAWRDGIQLGLRCVASCANLMVIPLVVGVMDMRAMLVVASGITAERLAPHGQRVARVTGVMLVAAGGLLLARVLGS